jgi:hypothetical protein
MSFEGDGELSQLSRWLSGLAGGGLCKCFSAFKVTLVCESERFRESGGGCALSGGGGWLGGEDCASGAGGGGRLLATFMMGMTCPDVDTNSPSWRRLITDPSSRRSTELVAELASTCAGSTGAADACNAGAALELAARSAALAWMERELRGRVVNVVVADWAGAGGPLLASVVVGVGRERFGMPIALISAFVESMGAGGTQCEM